MRIIPKAKVALGAIVMTGFGALLMGCSNPSNEAPTTDEPEQVQGGPNSGPNSNYESYAYWQEIPDEAGGGRVLCVWASQVREAGLSCDWEGYHRSQDNR